MTYLGYEVREEIIHDYEHPETAFVLDAPCGCRACQEQVQEGHFACSSYPKYLEEDENLFRRLENNRWFWQFFGPVEFIDEWLGDAGE